MESLLRISYNKYKLMFDILGTYITFYFTKFYSNSQNTRIKKKIFRPEHKMEYRNTNQTVF